MSRNIDTNGEAEQHRLDILKAIEDYTEDWGRPPTIREIGELAEISSTGMIYHHLGVLERQGRISRLPRLARTVRVVESPDARAG